MAEESDFFAVDQHRLDEEWVRQPKLFHEYAVKLADARAEVDRLKAKRDLAEEQVEYVAAEINSMIRQDPEQFGLPKVTEDAIKNAVRTHQDYIDAQEKVHKIRQREIEARREVGVLEAAVNALEHKKRSLENLVELFLRDYFSSPRAPKAASHAKMDEMKMEARKTRADNRRGKK